MKDIEAPPRNEQINSICNVKESHTIMKMDFVCKSKEMILFLNLSKKEKKMPVNWGVDEKTISKKNRENGMFHLVREQKHKKRSFEKMKKCTSKLLPYKKVFFRFHQLKCTLPPRVNQGGVI